MSLHSISPEEQKYRQQLVAKLEGYDAAGEPTPYLIFVDDICRDPDGLRAGLRHVIAELMVRRSDTAEAYPSGGRLVRVRG